MFLFFYGNWFSLISLIYITAPFRGSSTLLCTLSVDSINHIYIYIYIYIYFLYIHVYIVKIEYLSYCSQYSVIIMIIIITMIVIIKTLIKIIVFWFSIFCFVLFLVLFVYSSQPVHVSIISLKKDEVTEIWKISLSILKLKIRRPIKNIDSSGRAHELMTRAIVFGISIQSFLLWLPSRTDQVQVQWSAPLSIFFLFVLLMVM